MFYTDNVRTVLIESNVRVPARVSHPLERPREASRALAARYHLAGCVNALNRSLLRVKIGI